MVSSLQYTIDFLSMLLFVNYYSAYEGTKSFGDLPADQLHDTADALRTAVSRKLRSGSTAPAAALCRREVLYHWFPKGDQRAAITADEKDFPSPYFPPGWDRVLNIHGQGQRVQYPITLRPTVRRSPKSHSRNEAGLLVAYSTVSRIITATACYGEGYTIATSRKHISTQRTTK